MNRFFDTLLTLIVGVAIGVVAGILMAPKKGSEMQNELKSRGKRIIDDLEDQLEQGKHKLDELSEKVKDYRYSPTNGTSNND